MKKTTLYSLLFVFFLFMSGCQSIPSEPLSTLSPKQDNETGRVVIRPYYMPLGANFIALFMAGGTTPFDVELFDVTDQPKYLGDVKSDGVRTNWPQRIIEYDTQPGIKVLMLRAKGSGNSNHIDFNEVNVAANQIVHVALSQ